MAPKYTCDLLTGYSPVSLQKVPRIKAKSGEGEFRHYGAVL